MPLKPLVVIPSVKGNVMWNIIHLIKQQTFQADYMIVTNEMMDLPKEKQPTWGHKTVTWAMQRYHPEAIIFHPSDCEVWDNTVYQQFVDALKDENCIGAGIRPRSRQGGNWHLANYGDRIDWSGFLSIYSNKVYPYVENYLKIQTNTDTWHEACYGAIEDDPNRYFKPISALVTYTNVH